jgi:hypothetical protein
MGQSEVDAHPDCMLSGDYHKMVRNDSGAFGGFRTHTVIPWSGNDFGDGILSSPDAIEFRWYPYTRIVAAQLNPEEVVHNANLGSA